MTTLNQISNETGLSRSVTMYPRQTCGNGWRSYTLRRSRELMYPLFVLARAGDKEALASALASTGEQAPRTTATAMIRAARRSGDLPPVLWARNERNIRLGAYALHYWCGEWSLDYMFGA